MATMDREVTEALAYFRENVSELKTLGKEWGLSDSDINDCIQRAMSADVTKLLKAAGGTTRLKFAARRNWTKLKVGLVIGGVLLLVVGALVIATQNDYVHHRIEQTMAPLMYPVLRAFRLMCVPLHAYPFTYDMYNEGCVVRNPLFSGGSGEGICENCQNIKRPTEYTKESLKNGAPPAAAFIDPLLFRGHSGIVNLKKLQETLSPISLAWQPMPGITTNQEWVSQVKDLFQPDAEERLKQWPDFYFHWTSKLTSGSQLIRKVFPRPSILGEKEVSLKKNLYLDGPLSASYNLPENDAMLYNWYVQGWGTRKLVLTPVPECVKSCQQLNITLQAGDLLTYSTELYRVESIPAGDDISIAVLSFFSPE